MAISKIVYKTSSSDTGTVWMDTTDKTVTAASMLNGITALKADGTTATGNIASKTSSDLTANVLTVTAPAGYYGSDATKTLSDQNLLAENIKKDISIFGVTGSYEGGGGQTSWETTYNGTVSVQDWGEDLYYAFLNDYFATNPVFAFGDTYRITWGLNQYTCVVQEYDSTNDSYMVGNAVLFGGSTGDNEPFVLVQAYDSNDILIGTTTSPGTVNLKIEKQVSGGGSNWTLLASDEVTVNTSSTTATDVKSVQFTESNDKRDHIFYVEIFDKAGKRDGYFYGTIGMFVFRADSSGGSSGATGTCIYERIDNNSLSAGANASGSGYGVYCYSLSANYSTVTATIRSRYNSTNSKTINGTYSIKIYELDWPSTSPQK